MAGGTGTRMGSKKPKQFLELKGVPIVIHSIRQFLHWDKSMPLVLVMHTASRPEWDIIAKKFLSEEEMQRVTVCDGGAERSDSVHNGLIRLTQVIGSSVNYFVAIHDAVRPFVTHDMLDSAFSNAQAHGASVCCVAVKSSIREIGDDGKSQAVDRSRFFHVQTPQTFPLADLLACYEKRPHNRFTDDASLYESFGNAVAICEGSYDNIKITTPEDLFVGEKILGKRS